MKDCFLKIEQEDEERVRFKQCVVRRFWRLTLYQYLGRVVRPWQRLNLLIKTYSVEMGSDGGACLARTFAAKKLIGF